MKRREEKSKGAKERYTHLNAELQRIARREKKAFLSDQCKEIEENNRLGKSRDLFKKIRDTKGMFHAKMESQVIYGVTGKFGLGIQSEAGQRLTEFCQKNALVRTPSSNDTRDDSTHGHHQMVNKKIRLIIFFAAKDGEALYSQQKQGQEMTVAQIMNTLLPNSDLN